MEAHRLIIIVVLPNLALINSLVASPGQTKSLEVLPFLFFSFLYGRQNKKKKNYKEIHHAYI
jgi:hypothetical protein